MNLYPGLVRAAREGKSPERFAGEIESSRTSRRTSRIEERDWLQRVEHPPWPLVRIRVHPGTAAAACGDSE